MSTKTGASQKPPKRVLDLFCGAGGLSLGFQSAGFEIEGGVDFDANAIKTFAQNFPNATSWLEDLSSPTPEFVKWLKSLKGEIDVIVGGPPCQGFSIAGKRDPNDIRNQLYQKYIDAVKTVRPNFVVIENVPNIVSMNQGAVSKAILKDLAGLGYNVKVETLNASFFGVPQARRRVFFIGTLSTKEFVFPATDKNAKLWTTFEALSDLPSLDSSSSGVETKYKTEATNEYQKLMRKNSRIVSNHERVNHTEKTRSIIALVPDGGNFKSLPLELQSTRNVKIAWTRMNSNKPSFTIDAGHNHHFHYAENRVPSVRECARVQSFPDSFQFEGNRTSQYRQVGNAVPPLLAKHLAEEVWKHLGS